MAKLPAVFSTSPRFLAVLFVLDLVLLYYHYQTPVEEWEDARWVYTAAAAAWVTVYALIKLVMDNGFN